MSTPAPVMETTTSSSQPLPTNLGLVWAVGLLTVLAHVPLLLLHFQQLWLKPHYQLFPIVLAGSFVLLWPWKSFAFSAPTLLRTSLWLMIAAAAILVIGVYGDSASSWGITFVTPVTLIAVSAVLMYVALPFTIVGGPTLSFANTSNPRAGTVFIVLAWVLLAVCLFFNSPAGAAFTGIVALASLALTIGGRPYLRRCLPGIAFLLLIVPPPFQWDTMLVQGLQVLASKMSSRILDFMGVLHNLNGVQIEVGAQTFMVEDGCSGISSLLSTLACVLFYVLWNRIHWLRATVLTLSAIFWVLVNNTARIIGITFFGVGFNLFGKQWKFDLSTGVAHQLFGVFLFLLTLFLLWSTDRFLMFIGRSNPPTRRFEPLAATPEAVRTGLNKSLSLKGAWYRSAIFALAFGLLVFAQVAEAYATYSRVPYSGSALSKIYEGVDVAVMPEMVGPWKRPEKLIVESRAAGNPLGQFSRMWRYGARSMQGALSLDYPYPMYHDLRVCYSNLGWQIKEATVFDHQPAKGSVLHCVRATMEKPVEQYAMLWFCNFDQDGVGVDPGYVGELAAQGVSGRIYWRIKHEGTRWQRVFAPSSTPATTGSGSILQVQLILQDVRPFADDVVKLAEELFLVGAERIRDKCVELKKAAQ